MLLGRRVILEACLFPRRDEGDGVVDRSGLRGLVPQSSDVILALGAIERNASLGEGLGGGQSR